MAGTLAAKAPKPKTTKATKTTKAGHENPQAEAAATIFKALCEPKRVAVLQLLQGGERCACHIAEELGMAQSKLSYHMKILCDSGLVECWYVGKWTHYKISQSGAAHAANVLQSITMPAAEPATTNSCCAGS